MEAARSSPDRTGPDWTGRRDGGRAGRRQPGKADRLRADRPGQGRDRARTGPAEDRRGERGAGGTGVTPSRSEPGPPIGGWIAPMVGEGARQGRDDRRVADDRGMPHRLKTSLPLDWRSHEGLRRGGPDHVTQRFPSSYEERRRAVAGANATALPRTGNLNCDRGGPGRPTRPGIAGSDAGCRRRVGRGRGARHGVGAAGLETAAR